MIQIDMEMPKDCRMCPFMATDGIDTLAPMMCVVIWGKNHEKKHCIQGKVRDDCPLKEVPTGKWISTKQLEDMYKKFERKLWNEREDVRGDDMVEIGFAEQFLQDGLMELGCWDDVVEEQQGENIDG